ncbi:MAG: Lipid biosynthesis lauroyl acyltransferase [Labilithrix sp.]|nr:Lipid biosynthesis lauroyl acyltransferase [Labilithrix sp.]
MVGLLPWGSLSAFGRAVGFLAGSVLRIRRATVTHAITRAGLPDPRRVASAMYAGLGASLLELLWLAARGGRGRAEVLARHAALSPDLAEAIATAAARGPVVLAASHTANWELLAMTLGGALETRGSRLAVVVKPISSPVVHAFCTRVREAAGLVLIAPRGAMSAARTALSGGAAVAMVIDQVPDRVAHGLRVPFLGAPALADRAPATLAVRANATVLVVAAARPRAGGVQVVELLATLVPPAAGQPGRGAFVADATRAAQDALDAFVRRHPSSWLWLHRRWREPRGEARLPASGATLVATGQRG